VQSVHATDVLEGLGAAFVKCQTMSDGLSGVGFWNCHLDMEIRLMLYKAYYN
jgi:hypothetical protein